MTPRPLPVLLDVAGRLVVVVGGGVVGSRKAAAAVAAGAVVRVVEPRGESGAPTTGWVAPPSEAAGAAERGVGRRTGHPVADAPGSPELIPEPYRPEHLDGAALVFACATPEVNARVVADAKARGVWVNSASAPAAGDFTLPSVVRSGDLTIAVGTGGASPALARRIREKLEAELDAAFADWVRVLAEVRAAALAEVPDPERRRELLDSFADWSWLARVRAEGADAAKAAMLAELM